MLKYDVVSINKTTGEVVCGIRFDTYDDALKFIEFMKSDEELDRMSGYYYEKIIEVDVSGIRIGL